MAIPRLTLSHPQGEVLEPDATAVHDAVELALGAGGPPASPPGVRLASEAGGAVVLHGPLLEVEVDGRRYRLDPRPLALAAMERLACGEDPRGRYPWYEVPDPSAWRAARRRRALLWVVSLLLAVGVVLGAWWALVRTP